MAYRTIIIAPYAVAPLVAGVMWFFLFSPAVGVLEYGLRFIGVRWNHSTVPGQAFLLVVVAASWQRVAYNFLFYLAGMQSIPDSLVEGGPSNATATMVYRIYRDGLRGLDFGGSAAQSVILMAFVITVVALQFRYVERKVFY